MLQYVHVASTFGLCSCHLVISHARMNPNPLHAAPSVMMRKGFEPKPGSWSSNSGDKILGFLQQTLRFWWLSNSSFKTGSWVGSKLSKFRHCRFHVFNFSQSIQELSAKGNFEGNSFLQQSSLDQWCYPWLVSYSWSISLAAWSLLLLWFQFSGIDFPSDTLLREQN